MLCFISVKIKLCFLSVIRSAITAVQVHTESSLANANPCVVTFLYTVYGCDWEQCESVCG